MKAKIKTIENSYLLYLFLQTILIISLLLLAKSNFSYGKEKYPRRDLSAYTPVIIGANPDFDFTSLEIYQYHYNSFQNMSNNPVEINGKTINSGQIDSILITNEESVSININGNSYLIQTKENQLQKIEVKKLAYMSGEDVKLSDLQKVVGYRITINDDFAYQLNWDISGPVSYKVVRQTDKQIIIDITLNAYPDNKSFDKYAQTDRDGKYTSVFNISIKDNISQYNVSDKGTFIYTEW